MNENDLELCKYAAERNRCHSENLNDLRQICYFGLNDDDNVTASAAAMASELTVIYYTLSGQSY